MKFKHFKNFKSQASAAEPAKQAFVISDYEVSEELLPSDRVYALGRVSDTKRNGLYQWYLYDFATGAIVIQAYAHGTREQCFEQCVRRLELNNRFAAEHGVKNAAEHITNETSKLSVINTL